MTEKQLSVWQENERKHIEWGLELSIFKKNTTPPKKHNKK